MVNEFEEFTTEKKLIINDMGVVISFNFSRNYAFPPDLSIGGSEILREVNVTKLLGVKLQSNLKWGENTNYIYSRASVKTMVYPKNEDWSRN